MTHWHLSPLTPHSPLSISCLIMALTFCWLVEQAIGGVPLRFGIGNGHTEISCTRYGLPLY